MTRKAFMRLGDRNFSEIQVSKSEVPLVVIDGPNYHGLREF